MDRLSVDTLRTLALEQINSANSGHPGIALGAAPIMHALYRYHLRYQPQDPQWLNRDRFVLAAGHGSSLLYATLHVAGFDVSREDLQAFRSLGSKTPGHPEYRDTPGVDCTSGPLGQGFASAVGMALAESHLNKKFSRLIDHYTYVLCGDGDLQEGVALEAASLAGHFKLNKLIVLFDSNDVQLDGPVKLANTENVRAKFEAMNWNTVLVEQGDDPQAISAAIAAAKLSKKPVLIEVKTIIGATSSRANSHKVHGSPLPSSEVELYRKKLGGAPFSVERAVYRGYEEHYEALHDEYQAWLTAARKNKAFQALLNEQFLTPLDEIVTIDTSKSDATRNISGNILNQLSVRYPQIIAGSADLVSSTKVQGADGDYTPSFREGRNIRYGVREHAMAALANGIALHGGLRPVVSGFFVFSDYLKPALRLSALMGLGVVYVFTHDSIAVGEDGPTHQPIEQLTMLRSIPKVTVIRPADANETLAAYQIALQNHNRPTVLVLTRQNTLPVCRDYHDALMGGYVVRDDLRAEGVLIATGSEVGLAVQAQQALAQANIYVRVVSIPSLDIFKSQTNSYQQLVLPNELKRRVVIEMSEAAHLYQLMIDRTQFKLINLADTFGASGPADDVIEKFGFDVERIVNSYRELL